MTIGVDVPDEPDNYITDQKVDMLSKEFDRMSRAEIQILEDVIHQLPSANESEFLDPDEAFAAGETALLELISKREFVVALAKAGFAPPGSVAERKLAIEAFFDAAQRSKVLPYDTEREISVAKELAARAQLSYEEWVTQTRIEQITRDGKVAGAEIQQEIATANARIELAEARAEGTRRLNDVSDIESLERARQALFNERDELNLRNAQVGQLFAERESSVAGLEEDSQLRARERVARIHADEQRRKDRVAALLPNFLNVRRANKGKA